MTNKRKHKTKKTPQTNRRTTNRKDKSLPAVITAPKGGCGESLERTTISKRRNFAEEEGVAVRVKTAERSSTNKHIHTSTKTQNLNKSTGTTKLERADSMRSMRGLFSVVEGPCKRYAMAPTESLRLRDGLSKSLDVEIMEITVCRVAYMMYNMLLIFINKSSVTVTMTVTVTVHGDCDRDRDCDRDDKETSL